MAAPMLQSSEQVNMQTDLNTLATLAADQLQSVPDPSSTTGATYGTQTRSYKLNRKKNLDKKKDFCNRPLVNMIPKDNGRQLKIECSTGCYELLKVELSKMIQDPHFTEKFSLVFTCEPVYDRDGNVPELIIKATNRLVSGQPGKRSKFTVNLYNSQCSLLVNGNSTAMFQDEILPELIDKILQRPELPNIDRCYAQMIDECLKRSIENPDAQTSLSYEPSPSPNTNKDSNAIQNIQLTLGTSVCNSPNSSSLSCCPHCSEKVDVGLACDSCSQWYHFKCEALDDAFVGFYEANTEDNPPYTCLSCRHLTARAEQILALCTGENDEQIESILAIESEINPRDDEALENPNNPKSTPPHIMRDTRAIEPSDRRNTALIVTSHRTRSPTPPTGNLRTQINHITGQPPTGEGRQTASPISRPPNETAQIRPRAEQTDKDRSHQKRSNQQQPLHPDPKIAEKSRGKETISVDKSPPRGNNKKKKENQANSDLKQQLEFSTLTLKKLERNLEDMERSNKLLQLKLNTYKQRTSHQHVYGESSDGTSSVPFVVGHPEQPTPTSRFSDGHDSHILQRVQGLEHEMVKMRLTNLEYNQQMNQQMTMQMNTLVWNSLRQPPHIPPPLVSWAHMPTLPPGLALTPQMNHTVNCAPQFRQPPPTVPYHTHNPVPPSNSIPARHSIPRHPTYQPSQQAPNTNVTSENIQSRKEPPRSNTKPYIPNAYQPTSSLRNEKPSHTHGQKRRFQWRRDYQAPRHLKQQTGTATSVLNTANPDYQADHSTPKRVRFVQDKQVINISDVSKLSTTEEHDESLPRVNHPLGEIEELETTVTIQQEEHPTHSVSKHTGDDRVNLSQTTFLPSIPADATLTNPQNNLATKPGEEGLQPRPSLTEKACEPDKLQELSRPTQEEAASNREEGPTGRSHQTNISLATLNVKNVATNELYVKNLIKNKDIICLQEHWLFQFQLPKLNQLHDNYVSHAKAVDEKDPIAPIQIPRGYGGNCILYRKDWDIKATQRPDGSERIVVLELDTDPKTCIISVYLPCRGNNSNKEYVDALLELEELLNKYTSDHATFICGDFNASISRSPPNDRDKLLTEFIKTHNLMSQQSGTPTFFHASGDASAELDYIFKNKLAAELSGNVETKDQEPDNVSDHTPVVTNIHIQTVRKSQPAVFIPKPNWRRCDKTTYKEEISNQLQTKILPGNETMEEDIHQLKDVLDTAAQRSIPGYIPNTTKKCKKKKRMSTSEIQEASSQSKLIWWSWKCAGAPTDQDHPLKIEMKKAKQQLRKAQRMANAESRRQNLREIMEAPQSDAMFHRLVRNQRTTNSSSTNTLLIGDSKLTSTDEILKGWADHFESLATPKTDDKYNAAYQAEAKQQIAELSELAKTIEDPVSPTSCEEVGAAISKLNSNKAPDHLGLTSEHFKLGGPELTSVLVNFINKIFRQKSIPNSLKLGTITPIFKKGDVQNPDNYRGITVTPVFLKVLEHILNERHKQTFASTQSKLQTGFTKGTSSVKSALLVSECIQEAKSIKKPLIFITLDTRKAFDVVNHELLLRNLLLDGIPLTDWSLLMSLYSGMQSKVKWTGQYSEIFEILQGVRQGGILSTEHYKRYNNPLLQKLESKFEGAKIGNTRIPHTTCADDLALLSHSPSEINEMLETVETFSRDNRYDINATKSACIMYGPSKKQEQRTFRLEGNGIPVLDSTTHLGINRNKSGKVDIDGKINLGRRTVYSLLGAGLHGNNGLKQDTKAYLWTTYVIPRMLFGVEMLPYKQSDLAKLDCYQTKTLKQIQHLPDRTANSIAGALLGVIPLSVQVHRNTLNLFFNTIANEDSVESVVVRRHLAVKPLEDSSFFSRARRLLLLYNLPNAYSLLEDIPHKAMWKSMLNDSINQYCETQWKEDISTKSSLRYVNPASIKAGKSHHVYTTVHPNQRDAKRAELKARLLTGTYTLQSNRAIFNQYTVDPTCKMCNDGPESRRHFIATCPSLVDIRKKYLSKLASVLQDASGNFRDDTIHDPDCFTQLILDCTHPTICNPPTLPVDILEKIELLSREYLSKLHHKRCYLLAGPNPLCLRL